MLVKALRPFAVLAGALIVVWLVWEIGISTLVYELRKLSWRLPLILLPQVVTNLFKTEAWRLAFPAGVRASGSCSQFASRARRSTRRRRRRRWAGTP